MKEDIIEKDNQNRLNELRNLLVHDLIEKQNKIFTQLDSLESTINNPDLLKEKVSSILDDQTHEMKHKFDELFGQEVAGIIKNSEPQLLKALTPIMGKLIQKWIAFEMNKVQSRVNEKISKSPISTIFKKLFRAENSDDLIAQTNTVTIKDILIIEKKASLVVCNFAVENPINIDQVGGLMSAIKAFGEDALKVGYKEEIVGLKFQTYEVIMQIDLNYYAAILLDGVAPQDFKSKLKKTVASFIIKNINNKDFSKGIPEEELSEKLRKIVKEKNLC